MNHKRTLIFGLLLLFTAISLNGQGATDCRDFIVICSNTSLALSAAGTGTADFAKPGNPTPPCFQGTGNPLIENNSLWLKIPIASDGLLEFTLNPEADNDDFDFLLYGPNPNCNSLGQPVRCSTSSPVNGEGSKLTGLSSSVSDVSEGPGSGDGFVAALDVKAGEEYILYIDRFTQTNNGFSLEFGSDVVINQPPTVANPGDLEYCDPDGDGSLQVDLSELDNQLADGQTGVSVKYYSSETDALLDLNRIVSRDFMLTQPQTKVFATVTNTLTGCFALTSFDVSLTSIEPANPIAGPVSVCPTVDGIPYTTTFTNADFYEWFVDGGTVTSGQGTTDITVDWGVANDNAMLKMVGKTNNGCVSDTAFYAVKINKRLEPETPRGPVEVCFSDRLSTSYEVTQIPGSEYEWGVINGNIVGANDQNSIEVNWDGFSGTGRVFFREFNPNISECEGFSDTLEVVLLDEIVTVAEVKDLTCAIFDDGEIRVSVTSGAVGAVEVRWMDTGEVTNFREGLAPGTYEYSVMDSQGCLATGTAVVNSPDQLDFAIFTPLEASCFDRSDGGIALDITGGVSPYAYRIGVQGSNDILLSGNVNGSLLTVNSLGRGDYWVVAEDANNCELATAFTVGSPELLQADLQSLMVVPSCPQSATGSISLEAIGGTPDYQFTWVPNTDQVGNFVEDLGKGDYTVTIVDMNNCQASFTVTIEEVQPRVQVPNAFSPNNDSENDIFKPLSNCPLFNYQFSVFNRWGGMVFNTTDLSEGWDGRLEGEPAPIGRYSYRVSYRLPVEGLLVDESVLGVVRIFR